MDPNDIKNRASLEAWLNGRSRQDAISIAQRSALRATPIWFAAMAKRWARERDLTALRILREILISGVAAVYPTPEVRTASVAVAVAAFASAAFASASAADAAADAAASAASASAADAAAASASAASASAVAAATAAERYANAGSYFWEQVREDARAVTRSTDPLTLPLWSIPQPDWFKRADAQGRTIWAAEPATWSFWTRWWDGVLSGKQINWDLQRDVALIPDEDWQQGPAQIAELIAIKELAYLVEATPNSEHIARGPDGLFFAVPRTTIRPDLFRDAKERVSDTLVEIRAAVTSNSARYLESHLARLDAVLQRYPDRPQRVHDEFEQTRHAIEVMTKSEGLPSFELLDRLLRQLDDGAIDIRRSDKEVALTVKARASSRLHRMKAERKAKFDGAMNEAADESRLDLKQEILEDIAATNDPTVPEEQKDEPAYRLVSRGARMAKAAKDESVKAADDLGKIVRGAEAAGKIIEHAPGWWDIISTALFG